MLDGLYKYDIIEYNPLYVISSILAGAYWFRNVSYYDASWLMFKYIYTSVYSPSDCSHFLTIYFLDFVVQCLI